MNIYHPTQYAFSLPADRALDAEFYCKIDWLARVITERPFGEKHFETLNDIVERLQSISPEIQTSYAPANSRGTDLKHRAVNQHVSFYQSAGRYHQPCHIMLNATQQSFYYNEVWMPLFLNLEHVSFRHLERGNSRFYTEDSLALAEMALAFSRALGQMPELESSMRSERGLPMFLADSDGLYLCHAKWIPESEPEAACHIWRQRVGHGCETRDQQPSWSPRVRIYANSFVSRDDMSPQKQDLYYTLRGQFYLKDVQGLLEAAIMDYISIGFRLMSEQSIALHEGKQRQFDMSTSVKGRHKAASAIVNMDDEIPAQRILLDNIARLSEFDNAIIRLLRRPLFQIAFNRFADSLPKPDELVRRPVPMRGALQHYPKH